MSQGGPLNNEDVPVNVPTQFNADVGTAVPLLNQINIFGAGGATTSAVGNTITITAAGAGAYTWTVVTSALNPITLTDKTAYIVKGATPVQFILPAAAAIGTTFKIVGTANLWSIAQNAGQTMTIGMLTTTAGIAGSVSATMVSDGIEFVCTTTNLEFYEIGIQGNPNIV